VESLRLHTSDGEELGAWYLPGKPEQPAVILLHGNRATRSSMIPIAEFLHEAGHTMLMVTARAHGDSTGNKNDFGYSARHDVIAAVDELKERNPKRRIIVLGQSLGAAAALFAADELGKRVDGYILECPYQNLDTAVRNRTRAYLPWGLDWLAYAGLNVVAPVMLSDKPKIDPAAAAERVPSGISVLILAGGCDDRATVAEAHEIAHRLGNRARVEVFGDARHLGCLHCNATNYRRLVLEFLGGDK
jgi:alpha-beta hydrolase superfamily lysophospholipase